MMRTRIISFLLSIGLIIASAYGQDKKEAKPADTRSDGPQVGQPAPDFDLPWATQTEMHTKKDEWLKLSSQRGSNVILAFYPADWSGGCTTEVCTFRDNWNDLAKLNAKLLAISGDYVFSHQEWAKAHKLTFTLLQDHDHAVAKAYASFQTALGGINKRTVYLIDKHGVVRYRNLNFRASVKDDYDALRAELVKLQETASR